ncbi:hypothetical protein [Aequorivita sp. KMM 9714]|uniref:hypothetical protein n=1 Tax=Aequorivita sp. KMM 9714 TaxID=2707173 RepID=UPI0013EA3C35|nr:hypothetical protein [Aequorivita sp. KMM 9714]NGX85148.1 hypothetical protein [Aequorivita sp. KMM 9714]
MEIFKKICWIATIVGGMIGSLIFIYAMSASESDMQMGSLSAFAIGFVVLPYCIARAVSELK